ncbi:MAG: ATP-binding protein [Dissulfurispiraceae bacterium]|jgi:PAS domain S-box-containing protein
MIKPIVRKLQTINPWHFVWISVISSEILTMLLSVTISRTLWGSMSDQVFLVGCIDSFIVSLVVVGIIVYFLKHTAKLNELNIFLQTQIKSREDMEATLIMSEQRFRQMADNINEVFWIASLDFREVIYVSPAYEKIWDRSCESLYANPREWLGVIHPEDREKVANVFNKCRGEQNFVVEYRIQRSDNSIRWIYDRGFMVRNDVGQVYRMTGIAEDITERKYLEEQLRQSQKLEAIGILAGGVAHEFSNILTTIKGSMYLLQKKLQANSQTIKYAEQVVTSIDKANNLSQSLLSFSRKQTITLKPAYLNEIIHNMTKVLLRFIGEHIELSTILADVSPVVMADINQIEQVLINLTTNARDAMPTGGTLTIRTAAIEIDDKFKKEHGFGIPGMYVLMAVSDTGTGIEDKIKEKIFEPFFTTKILGKGSGLGLAVTYGIVKQHNGFIEVESVPGKGTTFNIYIPAVEDGVCQHAGAVMIKAKTGFGTILLAEDDADTRATMSEMLRITGYNVLEAGDGEEALRVFKENSDIIDLLVLDVRMPRRNGREAFDEIRKIRTESKALFISGYTADVIDSQGISEEGFNFISKGASPDEILDRIRKLLEVRCS